MELFESPLSSFDLDFQMALIAPIIPANTIKPKMPGVEFPESERTPTIALNIAKKRTSTNTVTRIFAVLLMTKIHYIVKILQYIYIYITKLFYMFYNIKIPTHCKLVTYISLTTNN